MKPKQFTTRSRAGSVVTNAVIASIFVLSGLALSGCGTSSGARTAANSEASETIGETTKAAPVGGIAFEEVAKKSGVRYQWRPQPRPLRNLEAFGTGCAFFDYDNDGWQDILLIDQPHAVLFRNQHDGTFVDVTATTGLDTIKGDWKGCAIGDYNGDGRQDLLLTGFRCLALLKNEDGERWSNATAQAGLDSRDNNHWGSSAGFMDLDGNGTLDLVLAHYVIFGPQEQQYCYLSNGIKSGCPPHVYRPEFTEVWKNLGNGKFSNVSSQANMKTTHGKALVVAFTDVNDDGRMDFYIGNDGTMAELMMNDGQMKFHNAGQESGLAYGGSTTAMAAMGADWADYDGDGLQDLVISGFSNESYSLQRNNGTGLFEQKNSATGLAVPTLKPLGFGTKWCDVDNDGWPDMIFCNGHVYDKSAEMRSQSVSFRQPSMLFHNQPGYLKQRSFVDIAPQLGGGWAKPILGRGLATGDYDNDGRMDVLIVDYEGEPLLLHNTSQTPDHWITLDLRAEGANRYAYGAKVTARKGKRIWSAEVSPASSYLSSSDHRVHFGLGAVDTLDTLTIRWPDGKKETLRSVPIDKISTIKQGHGLT